MTRKVTPMTRKKFMQVVEEVAKDYYPKALKNIVRNRQMNDLTKKDTRHIAKNRKMFQRLVEALLVDFINQVGSYQSLDYGMYTHYLHKEK